MEHGTADQVVLERPVVRETRERYLHEHKKAMDKGRSIVTLDKTWYCVRDSPNKEWTHKDGLGRKRGSNVGTGGKGSSIKVF